MSTPRTGLDAARWFRAHNGMDAYHNMCKAFVRTGLNVWPSQSNTAIECFNEIPEKYKHRETDPEEMPRWAPVWMNTSNPAEHIVFTLRRDKQGHRLCISTDAGPGSRIAIVRLADLADSWGPCLGWGEYLDGQRVWNPPR